jgi:hypothetical protein
MDTLIAFLLGPENRDIPVLGWILLILYPMPALIAEIKSEKKSGKIWKLNMFLGWTGVGWLVALVWALCLRKEIKK